MPDGSAGPDTPGPRNQPGSAEAANPFGYEEAFSRNLGWLTEGEQQALRGRHVAIAGLGGVGGVHLLTLARFGIGAFTLADFDRFSLANFNRQVGAMMSTLDQPKLDVLEHMARDINPELRLRRFPQGVEPDGVDDFLRDADLYVDGVDFFAIDIRRRIFARCADRGIPAVTAAPIGMGTAWLAFVPGGMTFEQYFRLDGQPENEQFLRFLLGLTPRGLQRSYLVDPSRLNLAARRGPSTAAGCQLAAGVTAVAAVKLLLGRGDVKAAPFHHHFDPYVGRYVVTRLRRGNGTLAQRARLAIARRVFASAATGARGPTQLDANGPDAPPANVLDRILSAARWAPSGDNQQPWTFERRGDNAVLVRVSRRSPDNVYEFRDGEPLLLGAGMLLASLEIAASAVGRRMEWSYEGTDPLHRIGVSFVPTDIATDRLYGVLPLRSVDRRPYGRRPLQPGQKAALETVFRNAAAQGEPLELVWHERPTERWAIARLGATATDIRLRARETFETHRQVIDWTRRLSPTGIPAGALGLPRAMLAMMRWQMQDWARTDRANRVLGTSTAALQLDLLPGMSSAGFFSVRSPGWAGATPERVLRAGWAVQRFWLEATRLGLAIQPALATVIFADHGASRTPFTVNPALLARAEKLARAFRSVFRTDPGDVAFLGRIGHRPPRPPTARSVRRNLTELMTDPAQAASGSASSSASDGSPTGAPPTGQRLPPQVT